MKPYYYVYRVGHGNHKVKHPTLESAQKESIRLSEQHPGDSFELLMCLGVTRTTKPGTFWLDGVIPPHICTMNRILDDTCIICGKNVEAQPTEFDVYGATD